MKFRILILSLVVVMLSTAAASAQSRVVVKFARGAHSATLAGSVQKYRYVDYTLNAREGQTMYIELTSAKGTAEFVVFDPNGENVEDATGVTEYSGVLAMSGNYRVRVLLPRSDARRAGSLTSYAVKFTVR